MSTWQIERGAKYNRQTDKKVQEKFLRQVDCGLDGEDVMIESNLANILTTQKLKKTKNVIRDYTTTKLCTRHFLLQLIFNRFCVFQNCFKLV